MTLISSTHVEHTAAKYRQLSVKLAKILPIIGENKEHARGATVAEYTVLYACPEKAGRLLALKKNRRAPLSAQGATTIRVAMAYKTIATATILIIARTIP